MKKTKSIISIILILSVLLSGCAAGAPNMAPTSALSGNYDTALKPAPPGEDLTGESYTEIRENQFVNAVENNTSYFSIDANTTAYPNLRSMIRQKFHHISADAVRIEEMLNYFDYDYIAPTDGSVLALTASMFDTPYNSETKLLTIGLAAQEVEFSSIQNNLVFLIDTSGSMFGPDRLELVQTAFMMLAENLNPEDRVSIVTYAGDSSVALEGAYGYEKQKIMAVIEDLQAGGSTAGSKGIQTAYKLAERYFIEGGTNRVILATDGDFNVGVTSEKGLENLISEKRQSGVYFSVFGVGRGNLQSDKMETLALKGNGTCSYIDSQKEARRALVEQIGGSMITVAKDVKAGITFNQDYIESYRLIGYENKLLTQEEFEDANTDAGELGSGHTVTVVYEVKLTEKVLEAGENLAQVIIKYKPTENVDGNGEEQELILDVGTEAYGQASQQDAFVAAVVEFALILRNSEFKKDASLQDLAARLESLDLSDDAFKEEFRSLVLEYMDQQKQ